MRNDRLRTVFESLGLDNVRTVISSGNVLFEAESKDIKALEQTIETAIPKQLGFRSTTIIRSQRQMKDLVKTDPFKGMEHGPSSYLLVTFFKNPVKPGFQFPYQPLDGSYKLLGFEDSVLFSVIDTTSTGHSPDLMAWLEKQFGKDITSRTYKTVGRILKKLEP